MEKVIIRRFLSVLLCVSVFLYSFAFTSFGVSASSVDDLDITYVDYPISPSFSSRGIGFDFWDVFFSTWEYTTVDTGSGTIYDMHAPAYNAKILELAENHFPFGVTGNVPRTGKGAPVSDDDLLNNILFWYKGDYETLSLSSSYIIGFNPNGSLPYSCACSSSYTSFPTSGTRNIGSSNFSHFCFVDKNFTARILFFGAAATDYDYLTAGSIDGSNGFNLGNSSDASEFAGYLICPRDLSAFAPPFAPDNATDVYFSPSTGLQVSKLIAKTTDDDFVYFDGSPAPDPTKEPADGSTNGDITVGGKIEVGGKVDVGVDVNVSVPDININVNTSGGSGDGSSYDMPDTGFFNDYLDEALEETSGIRRFISDFFGCLPGQITTLICIGLVLSILARIIGR